MAGFFASNFVSNAPKNLKNSIVGSFKYKQEYISIYIYKSRWSIILIRAQ